MIPVFSDLTIISWWWSFRFKGPWNIFQFPSQIVLSCYNKLKSKYNFIYIAEKQYNILDAFSSVSNEQQLCGFGYVFVFGIFVSFIYLFLVLLHPSILQSLPKNM